MCCGSCKRMSFSHRRVDTNTCISHVYMERESNVSRVSSGESKRGYSNVPCSLLVGFFFFGVCFGGQLFKTKSWGKPVFGPPQEANWQVISVHKPPGL